ncbi:MAG TPA: MFS transporter, partial [Phaeodactylibacter sp.]|nr:MFS transporter [Phaeodactylibacter sp.]
LIVTGALLAIAAYVLIKMSVPYGLFVLFLTAIAAMLMMIYQELDKVQRDRFLVLLISFIIVIIFWGAFEQAGGLMNIYTEKYTNREVMGITIPAAVMQSWNPLFIIIFGVPVAAFWQKRKMKGKEASSLFKMMVGLIIMGSGFLWMRGAALQYQEVGQSALFWLILAYLFHTIGELCASPVALSFITKLAPVKYASLMMGVYFAVTGLGNKVAGIIGESATEYGELAVFTGIAVFCIAMGALLLLLLKPLKRLTHGIEEAEVAIPPIDNEP